MRARPLPPPTDSETNDAMSNAVQIRCRCAPSLTSCGPSYRKIGGELCLTFLGWHPRNGHIPFWGTSASPVVRTSRPSKREKRVQFFANLPPRFVRHETRRQTSRFPIGPRRPFVIRPLVALLLLVCAA